MNGNYKFILTIVTLVSIIVAGGIAWGSLRSRVDATERDLTDIKADIKADLRVIREDIKKLLTRIPAKE